MWKILLLLTLVGLAVSEKARFDNYRVYNLKIENAQQLETLQEMENYRDGYTFWDSPTQINMAIDVVVPPHKRADFADMLELTKIENKLTIENFQTIVDNEQPTIQPKAFGWTSYHRLDDIYVWMDEIAAAHPGVVTLLDIGATYEGRRMRGVKISYGPGHKGIFIEANIHAREWISSATATFVINELLASTNPSVRDIAESHDWYIFPVCNPDGYEFAHTNNRQWRKTRSVGAGGCVGTDPNRNFGYNWMQGGSSTNACSDTFAGTEAFSEIETRNIRDYYDTVAGNMAIYLSFHSYGQYLLIPWGTNSPPIPNFANLLQIANSAHTALQQRYGTTYSVGNTVSVLYVASGTSPDWAYGAYQTPISYTYEFRDTGATGFVLPAAQIIPNGNEVVDSLVGMVLESRNLGYL